MAQGGGVPTALEGFLEEAGSELVRVSPAGESVTTHRGPEEEAHGRGGGATEIVGTSLASLNPGSRPRLLSV